MGIAKKIRLVYEKEARIWDRIKGVATIITGVISVIALLISSINLYYQFFKKSNDLKASIFPLNVQRLKFQIDTFTFTIAFVNGGNQSSLISNILLCFYPKDVSNHYQFIEWTRNDDGSSAQPIVMKPGEIILKGVVFDYKDDIKRFLSDLGIKNKEQTEIDAKIKFIVIDSLGKKYEIYYEGIKFLVIDFKIVGHTVNESKILTLLK
mgnify:CR=1 FL=1